MVLHIGRAQDITLGHIYNAIFQRPTNVGRGRPLALHGGPYGEVHRTSFGEAILPSGMCV